MLYEHMDVIASPGAVMEINTKHYKSDFQYNREMFQKAAKHPDSEPPPVVSIPYFRNGVLLCAGRLSK